MKGRPLSDHQLGVSCTRHPKDSKLCLLQYSDQGEVIETVELWRSHVDSLKALHRDHIKRQQQQQQQQQQQTITATAAPPSPGRQPYRPRDKPAGDKLELGLVLARIFTMALRYDSLSGCKCAYQAALPPPVMDLLKHDLGCTHECYASPLNQYLGSFCSAFADTDTAFGSLGSFFEYHPSEGSFECNPPFDARSINSCLDHVLGLLRAKGSGPLSFVLTVPTLEGTHTDVPNSSFRALKKSYQTAAVGVQGKEHSYQMGLQHRPQPDGVYWNPEIPSTAYIFQNESGRHKWPVSEAFSEQLRRAWDWRGTSTGAAK